MFGLLGLGGVLWHIGLAALAETLGRLEPTSALVVLLPSVLIYLVDTVGWHCALPSQYAKEVSVSRLLAIRMGGETVNLTTPTAYLGGEPLKSYLLYRYGVPLMDALVSVVIAKTTITIAQIAYILVGLALGVWMLSASTGAAERTTEFSVAIGATLAALAMLVLGVIAMVAIQRRGIFRLLFTLKSQMGFRNQYLEARIA